MFVLVVLNTEYMALDSRKVWYFKAINQCRNNGWALISHEYIGKHREHLYNSIDDRLLSDFEVGELDDLNFSSVPQYYIPDRIFDEYEKNLRSRTAALFELYETNWPELENELLIAIDSFSSIMPVKGIFHLLEPFESLRKVSLDLSIPLIPFTFSAIRRVHGYMHTLYSAPIGGKLYDCDDCEQRYQNFQDENVSLPLLSHRCIIALLGKTRTLPLIPLLDKNPPFELLLCENGYEITPQVFNRVRLTDDDLYYAARKLFLESKIRSRPHALKIDRIGVDRSTLPLDPTSTILSCKRCVAVSSQILLKAMLWNRTVVMRERTLPFSFACESDLESLNKVELSFLNFYVLCYLIPNHLMFSQDYWLWRLKRPSESEILGRHLCYFLGLYGLDFEQFYGLDEEKMFRLIMGARGYSHSEIERIIYDPGPNFMYQCSVSRLIIFNQRKNQTYDQWILNRKLDDDFIVSEFIFFNQDDFEIEFITFMPIIDFSAFVSVNSLSYAIENSGDYLQLDVCGEPRFIPQGNNGLEYKIGLTARTLKIKFIWKYTRTLEIPHNASLAQQQLGEG